MIIAIRSSTPRTLRVLSYEHVRRQPIVWRKTKSGVGERVLQGKRANAFHPFSAKMCRVTQKEKLQELVANVYFRVAAFILTNALGDTTTRPGDTKRLEWYTMQVWTWWACWRPDVRTVRCCTVAASSATIAGRCKVEIWFHGRLGPSTKTVTLRVRTALFLIAMSFCLWLAMH